MRLVPADLPEPTAWEDGPWAERPGFPWYEGTWVHAPVDGQAIPEFEFEEGHDLNKNKAPPVLTIGSGNDAHIRQVDKRVPQRQCQLLKIGRNWVLEGVSPSHPVYRGSQVLRAADRVTLKDGDTFSLLRPPTKLAYRILIRDEDNWYIDESTTKDYPNKHRCTFPFRPALESKECPDELKRLAWQTDQMRRRSEEDQVRVADWAAFSQYVKRHYLRYGIDCKPWVDTRLPHDEKPPSYVARTYPDWIADLVAKERQLPGIAAERAQPFATSLGLSGRGPAAPLAYRGGEAPRLEDLYDNPVATGAAEPRRLGLGKGVGGEEPGAAASGGPAAGGAGGAGQAQRQDPKVEAAKKLSFREWLVGMDKSLYLLQYHDGIAENFDSLEQVLDLYVKNGDVQKSFFEDAGIRKLGHRRIFEKWFADTFGTSEAS